MGLFKRFFGSQPKRTQSHPDDLRDPDFGTIWPCSDADWEGESTPFAHAPHPIGVSLGGDSKGPSDDVRKLFVALRERYPKLLPDVARVLSVSLELSINADDLTLQHVSIGDMSDRTDLELGFNISSDSEHSYVAAIRDWSVISAFTAVS